MTKPYQGHRITGQDFGGHWEALPEDTGYGQDYTYACLCPKGDERRFIQGYPITWKAHVLDALAADHERRTHAGICAHCDLPIKSFNDGKTWIHEHGLGRCQIDPYGTNATPR